MNKHVQFLRESYPPAPEWGVDDIPDLTGRVMAITGANTGASNASSPSSRIDLFPAQALLQHNATVYMFCRSETRAKAAIADLKEQTAKEARFVQCDLSDLPSVKRCAEEFLSKESQLHVLFNNGGVMLNPVEQLTAQGYDMQFGTNVLAHFYLSTLLLPVMQATAQTTGVASRIVVTSSLMHWYANTINYDLLREPDPERTPAGKQRKCAGSNYLYSQSKLGNVLYAKELARRFGDKGIVCISLHPGQIKTELMRELGPRVEKVRGWLMPVHGADMGALTQLRAGTDPEAAGWNGKYMTCWARLYANNPAADDEAEARKLWEWMGEQVKGI
ncbi:hypothetical protein BD626DRAFT_555372 [Schizophyllum amplum]|uniref:NAD(P)-binding protein n=1 Tax=Schizophyllum amplum TaxID=97359 RepID=A0A550CNW3_9AGAR|nr:hypothetical protein BD626DRAFT_555372 [Auriculariopsis ampla]